MSELKRLKRWINSRMESGGLNEEKIGDFELGEWSAFIEVLEILKLLGADNDGK